MQLTFFFRRILKFSLYITFRDHGKGDYIPIVISFYKIQFYVFDLKFVKIIPFKVWMRFHVS